VSCTKKGKPATFENFGVGRVTWCKILTVVLLNISIEPSLKSSAHSFQYAWLEPLTKEKCSRSQKGDANETFG
jgi:hypothetical protein